MRTSVVIPCYCSSDVLSGVVCELFATLETPGEFLEIVLVNDDSPDQGATWRVICELVEQFPGSVVGVDLALNAGEHNAVLAGLRHATGDAIVVMDDDGQNPPCEVPKLLERLSGDIDVVYSTYEIKRHHWFRNLGSRFTNWMAGQLMNKPSGLYLSSFKVMHRRLVDRIISYPGSFPYIDGLVFRNTRRYAVVTVDHKSRELGTSGYTLRRLVRLYSSMAFGFSILPLRLLTFAGVGIAMLSSALALVFIGQYFVQENFDIAGWTSLAVLVTFFGGLTLFALGTLGEYFGRMYLAVNGKKAYVINQSIGMGERQAYALPNTFANRGITRTPPPYITLGSNNLNGTNMSNHNDSSQGSSGAAAPPGHERPGATTSAVSSSETVPGVPFLNLKDNYQTLRSEIDAAVQRVLESGHYVLGPECKNFENELSEYLGGGHVVGVASGTDALSLALLAAGVGPGDEVATVATTAIPVPAAIVAVGATPLFVDIDSQTWAMDPVDLEKRITPATKALIFPHLYGRACPLGDVMKVARKAGIVVIEDCAQAIGANLGGQKVGTLADFGAFSFYPTKNLGAMGDGGAVWTDSAKAGDLLKVLRNYGQSGRYSATVAKGRNSRLDELQAAILRAKLPHLEDSNARRRALGKSLRRVAGEHLQLPALTNDNDHVYHLFVGLAKSSEARDKLMDEMKTRGVATLVHYPKPLYKQPAFAQNISLPVTESVTSRILSLPLYPEMTDEAAALVASTLAAAAKATEESS